jgi:methionyl-tRNA formyltransferase
MPALKDCRIVFMGTPEFAVATLAKLVQEGCNIVGVVTAPDKPAGRGMQLSQSAVKQFAIEHNLPILQPVKLKDPTFLAELSVLKADLQVVVAFRMLPEVVWDMPPMGTLNLHGSLLPAYRGAAPINWAIINGEKQTGVTTFKLKQEIDTGDILLQDVIPIRDDETAGELHDEMKLIGANLIHKTLEGYCSLQLNPLPQDTLGNIYDPIPIAPKLTTDTARINWHSSAYEIYNLIRGLSPYLAAFTSLEGKMLKIFKATYEDATATIAPGNFDTDGKSYLRFKSLDGWINILELQLEGKKKMDVTSFLRGYRFL